MYLKGEIKVTFSQAYEYTSFVTSVHISVYMFLTILLLFLLGLLCTWTDISYSDINAKERGSIEGQVFLDITPCLIRIRNEGWFHFPEDPYVEFVIHFMYHKSGGQTWLTPNLINEDNVNKICHLWLSIQNITLVEA